MKLSVIDRLLPVAADVRRRRRALGWTQQKLADAAGVSRRLVSQLENGKRTLRMDGVERVLAALGAEIAVVDRPEAAAGRARRTGRAMPVVVLDRDPRTIPRDELIALFRRPQRGDGEPDVSDRLLLRSIVMWLHGSIERGEVPPVHGNLRSLWYEYCKPTFRGLPGVSTRLGYLALIRVLAQLVIDQRVLRYSDFGLADENWEHRRIGDRRPNVILYAEQSGWFRDLRKAHAELGCTVTTWQGQPSGITSEFTARHVRQAMDGDPRVHLVALTNWDPGGDLIMESFARQLEAFGARVSSHFRAIRPALYTDTEVDLHGYAPPASGNFAGVVRRWLERTGGTRGRPLGLSSQVLSWERVRPVVSTWVEGLDAR